MKESVVK